MSSVWTTASFPLDERVDALRDTIRASVIRVEIDLPGGAEELEAEVRISDVGRIRICSVRSTPTTVTRDSRAARDDWEPSLFLSLQMSGTSMMVQHGREVTLHPGEFAVYASTSPYTLLFGKGLDLHFFRFPLAEMALPESAVRDVSAIALGRNDGVARLASSYFQQLASSPELRRGRAAGTLAQPSIEMLRAALTVSLGDAGLSREPLAATLEDRLLQYLRAHLRDDDLTAARVAAAHHISVRHLYAVLARCGVSLGDWVRSQRLEECRRELARPSARARTIAAVAQHWGFSDATHFSRVFRRAYGMSPREWRELRAGPTVPRQR